jgi:hypothetical protein
MAIKNIRRQRVFIVLRWLTFVPIAITVAALARITVVAANHVCMLGPWGQNELLTTTWTTFTETVVYTGVTVLVSAYIAPAGKKSVAIIVATLLTTLAICMLGMAIVLKNYESVYFSICWILGAVAALWLVVQKSLQKIVLALLYNGLKILVKSLGGLAKGLPFAVFILFVVIGMKGCVVSTWAPPNAYVVYAIAGDHGRKMQLAFAPDRKAVVTYSEPSSESVEFVLLRFRWGNYCTHYIGPVYNVSRHSESIFGLRWCSDGAEPARVGYTIANKFRRGFGDSAFGEIGSVHEQVLYFKKDAVKFNGMWLTKQAEDPESIEKVLNMIDVPDEPLNAQGPRDIGE